MRGKRWSGKRWHLLPEDHEEMLMEPHVNLPSDETIKPFW